MNRRILTASLVTLLPFCLLVVLGVWQIKRLHWKEAMIGEITAGLARQPVNIADFSDEYFLKSEMSEFSHVSLSGKMHASLPLFLYGRTLNGTAGVHVLCIVTVQPKGGDNPDTDIVLDRGFLPSPVDPAAADCAKTRLPADGILRFAEGKRWFELDNNPAKNQWYWMDLSAMAPSVREPIFLNGASEIDSFYVEAITPTSEHGPIPTAGHLIDNIPNNHFQYALTWFGLAAALVFVYGAWVWQQAKERKA